jgi:hypothetical protein
VAAVLWPGPAGSSPRRATYFLSDQKVGKESPLLRRPSLREGSPAMLGTRGSRRTHFATLRSNNCAESVVDARFASASGSCASRLLQRGPFEQPSSQRPNPQAGWRRLFRYAPFSTAEERKALRACAQRTSRTDSVRLSERSVAKRVPRGPSRPEYRREPLAQRAAVRSGGALCLLSGGPENLRFRRSQSRSPAGANSRHHSQHPPTGAQT